MLVLDIIRYLHQKVNQINVNVNKFEAVTNVIYYDRIIDKFLSIKHPALLCVVNVVRWANFVAICLFD